MEKTPVYKYPAEYAREHGELPLYRESYKANIACKEAIEQAIREHYRDNRLDTQTICTQVGEKFGPERMAYVLSNTVRAKDWDGRISRENKAWAQLVPVTENPDAWGHDRNCCFVVDQAHPGLVDLLVTHVRKEQEKEKNQPEKKPSVLGKLQKPEAPAPAKAPIKKSKGQEL